MVHYLSEYFNINCTSEYVDCHIPTPEKHTLVDCKYLVVGTECTSLGYSLDIFTYFDDGFTKMAIKGDPGRLSHTITELQQWFQCHGGP